MKFNRINVVFLTSLFLLSSSSTIQCMQIPDITFIDKCCSRNGLIALASCAAVGYLGYKFYYQGKEYLENKIIDETVDAIVVGLTPVSSLNGLPNEEREKVLRKKARLINMRKRVLVKLNDQIIDTSNSLSQLHRDAIQEDIYNAKTAFIIIDAFRIKNSYEKDYIVASKLDQYIEDNIVSSIILVKKPDVECTQQELNEKQAKEQCKAKIVAKLQRKVNAIILGQLIQSALLFNLAFA